MAIASLIIGILGLVGSWVPFVGIGAGLLAIILGIIGRKKLLAEGRGGGLGVAGIAGGVLSTLVGSTLTVSCFLCAGAVDSASQDLAQQVDDAANAAVVANASTPGSETNNAGVSPTASGSGSASGGQPLSLNVPINGTFAPGLPTDEEGKPFIDYQLSVVLRGTYQIDLVTPDMSSYDPYLRILRNGVEVTRNDDGGDGLNSRVVTELGPGTYTVRVTKFGTGQATAAEPFTLTATRLALSSSTNRRRSSSHRRSGGRRGRRGRR